MDTERFDTVLTTSSTRRRALRSLASLATTLAVAAALGANDGEAKKKRKKGKKGKGNKSSGATTGGGSDDSGGGGNGGENTGGSGVTQSEEETLLGLINDFRAQGGQPALARNGKLDAAALNHSRDMANRGFFSHNTPEGGTPDQRILAAGYSFTWWGENIYKSAPNDASAQSAFTSWVNSTGHRANMLNGNFTQIGIGRATAADGRTYWTNTFGQPSN